MLDFVRTQHATTPLRGVDGAWTLIISIARAMLFCFKKISILNLVRSYEYDNFKSLELRRRRRTQTSLVDLIHPPVYA